MNEHPLEVLIYSQGLTKWLMSRAAASIFPQNVSFPWEIICLVRNKSTHILHSWCSFFRPSSQLLEFKFQNTMSNNATDAVFILSFLFWVWFSLTVQYKTGALWIKSIICLFLQSMLFFYCVLEYIIELIGVLRWEDEHFYFSKVRLSLMAFLENVFLKIWLLLKFTFFRWEKEATFFLFPPTKLQMICSQSILKKSIYMNLTNFFSIKLVFKKKLKKVPRNSCLIDFLSSWHMNTQTHSNSDSCVSRHHKLWGGYIGSFEDH